MMTPYRPTTKAESSIVLSGHLVETGILPAEASEMGRGLIIRGDALIRGPVYAEDFGVEGGNLEVGGAVYVRREFHVDSGATGKATFRKAFGAGTAIVSRSRDYPISFGADICAREVALKNAFIAANVFADTIDLEDCVVVGGVFAGKELKLRNSLVGTFNAPSVMLAGLVQTLLPGAFSVEPLRSPTGCELWNLALADISAAYFGRPEREGSGKVRMNPASDAIVFTLKDGKGNSTTMRAISVTNRVLTADMDTIERLGTTWLTTAASMGTHLLKSFDLGEGELDPGKIAACLFRIARGEWSPRELNSDSSVEDLRRRMP